MASDILSGFQQQDEECFTEALRDADETYIAYLKTFLSPAAGDYAILFMPEVLERLALIHQRSPEFFAGQFEPWLHTLKGLYVPKLLSAIASAGVLHGVQRRQHAPTGKDAPFTAILPPIDTYACASVRPWLDTYIAWSQRWSPRAASTFHESVGLWVLSTVAARRVGAIVGGKSLYTNLSIALIARSTLYAKTTTATLGVELVERAGLRHLLGADRTTPPALLRSMAGPVPANYGRLDEDAQQFVRHRLAHAGQRGWYYEEWGGMLTRMGVAENVMSDFHALLRVLDDGKDTFSSETIARGLEHIHAPYLALLGSATPTDMMPFMAPGAPWWHDGFWPRFVFACPPHDVGPSLVRRPQGAIAYGALASVLVAWHHRLGIPHVEIAEGVDKKGHPSGDFTATIHDMSPHMLTVPEQVYEAYCTYNETLLTMVIAGDIHEDYESWYARLHEKAMRVAILLASLQGATTLSLLHWSAAQAIAERWRALFHEAVHLILNTGAAPGKTKILEDRIIDVLKKTDKSTARELSRKLHTSAAEIDGALAGLLKGEHVLRAQQGRTTIYVLNDMA